MLCALKIFRTLADCLACSGQAIAQNSEHILQKYKIVYVEVLREWLFQARKFDGKNIFRAQKQIFSSGRNCSTFRILLITLLAGIIFMKLIPSFTKESTGGLYE